MRTAPTREERKARTRAELVAAADRLFTGNGFHATSLDAIADEAGYTKGAVYSSFESKEDLFFGDYEQRAKRGITEIERELAAAGGGGRGLDALALAAARRRGHDDDGWLAVFFEFWAHVVRRRRCARGSRRRWSPAPPVAVAVMAASGDERAPEGLRWDAWTKTRFALWSLDWPELIPRAGPSSSGRRSWPKALTPKR